MVGGEVLEFGIGFYLPQRLRKTTTQ
jgi:hypothetical protein